MSMNPYEAPKTESDVPPQSPDRAGAMLRVRTALGIMLLPALYNFVCFSFPAGLSEPGSPIRTVFLVVNGLGLIGVFIAIWFFGLTALELVTWVCQRIFARNSSLGEWHAVLYVSLRHLPVFALCGAILWSIWTVAFYILGMNFFALSVPIGIAAHLLAAGLYLPLFYRWYQLERAARVNSGSQS